MTLSVNTNTAASTALQYLNQTNSDLATTENRVSSGYKVASAKDSGSTYAIAQNMRGDVAGYSAVSGSINSSMSAIDVATSAGESISDLLIQLKETALSASDSSLDSSSRNALNEDFTALTKQISSIVDNADYNGYNMINGSTTQITALANSDGTQHITVAAQNFSLGGTIMGGVSENASVSTLAKASTMVSSITTALTNVDSALAKLSAGTKKLSIQGDFVSKLSDTLTTGIGNLVDADMSEESAKLTSLQTKQQLGVQALSIANSSSSIALSLFQ